MAPRPLPQSWPSPSPPHHRTLQWHPAMAPSNGTTGTQQWHTSTPPKLVVTLPSAHHRTLQWHPAMAPRPLHPAMAPWCHVQSAKVVRRPPPLLEVRTPIAIAIWGIIFHYAGWKKRMSCAISFQNPTRKITLTFLKPAPKLTPKPAPEPYSGWDTGSSLLWGEKNPAHGFPILDILDSFAWFYWDFNRLQSPWDEA